MLASLCIFQRGEPFKPPLTPPALTNNPSRLPSFLFSSYSTESVNFRPHRVQPNVLTNLPSMRRFHGQLSTIGNFSRENAHEKAYASGVRYNFQRDSLTIKRIGGEEPSTRTSEIREEIQSPVSFSLTHRGFSTPTTREVGGSPRREMVEKTGKTRLSTLPCIHAGGWKQRLSRLFRPSRGRLSGFLRDEPALFPPRFRRNMGSRSSARSRDRGSSLIELKKKQEKRLRGAKVASQRLDYC